MKSGKKEKKEAVKRIARKDTARKSNSKKGSREEKKGGGHDGWLIGGLIAGIVILTVILVCVILLLVSERNARKKAEAELALRNSTDLITQDKEIVDISKATEASKETAENFSTDLDEAMTETLMATESKETEAVTEMATEAGDTEETESESSNTQESETNGGSQTDGYSIDETVQSQIDKMTLEQKIDQMLILKPVTMVNVYSMENLRNQVGRVNMVGDTTRSAFERMQIGGMLITDNNKDDNDGTINEFVRALKDMSVNVCGVPVLLGVLEEERQLFESGNEIYGSIEPDFIVGMDSVEMKHNIQLKIKNLPGEVSADQVVAALTGDFDMVVISADMFDYQSVKNEMIQQLPEDVINQKVCRIITEKIATTERQTAEETALNRIDIITPDESPTVIGVNGNDWYRAVNETDDNWSKTDTEADTDD